MRITDPDCPRRALRASTFARRGLSALLVFSFLACIPRKGTIGAVISQDDDTGRLFLRDVPPKLAAAHADLKPGDEILTIDGADVRVMEPKQIHAALSGEVDSLVKLTLVRDEQILRVTLKRTEAQKFYEIPTKPLATVP